MYVFALILGVLCAGLGGEFFVRGSVNISRYFRVPVHVIGVTVAAFATSSPELAVAVTASLSGANSISLGDALGSNVVNVLLILGLALLIKPMRVNFKEVADDFYYAAFAPLLISLLVFDGVISRSDALIILLSFVGWLAWTIKKVLANKRSQEERQKISIGRSLTLLSGGLVFLIMAGRFIVYGASNIALALGVSPFVIGATIVAVATGAPEFATTLIARIKGHDELSLGTILGSNIFNALFIVAVAALITPIKISFSSIALPLIFGFLSIMLLMPKGNILNKKRGWLLIVTYLIYLYLLLNKRC